MTWQLMLAVAVFLGFIAGVTLGIPIVIRRWGKSCDKCVHRMWVYQNELCRVDHSLIPPWRSCSHWELKKEKP